MREYLKGVTVRNLQESDKQKCEGLDFDYLLESQAKIFEKDNLFVIINKFDYETYGKEKLCDVIFVEHSDVLNEDLLRVDFEQVVNDVNFNKPKTVEVAFVENIAGTNESIFRNVNSSDKFYIRQDIAREKYAKWFSAFKWQGNWEERASIRTNITFKIGEETEKVSYSNWNGEGVSSKDYNNAFSYKKLEQKATINKLVELSNKYKFKPIVKDDKVTLCAKNTDGKWTDWIRYDSNKNTVNVIGNTDQCNIWLSDTRKDLTPEAIINFVDDLNVVLYKVDAEVALKTLVDPEDWQEIANINDAYDDSRYSGIDNDEPDICD